MKWLLSGLILALVGCDMPTVQEIRNMMYRVAGLEAPTVPNIGNATILADGIRWSEGSFVQGNATLIRIWTAFPASKGKNPCLLWAPGSMGLKLGGRLDSEDREQMLLFARAGVGVVAFDVPGYWEDDATLDELGQAIDVFMAMEGGVDTARIVLDFIQTRLPRTDASRIWVGGEGVAGTLALLLAQQDRRIQAVLAFDPVTDMTAHVESQDMGFLIHVRPALEQFLLGHSPWEGVEHLRCPVLLYHDASRYGAAFEALHRFYMECLRWQKDVTMMDLDAVDAVPVESGRRLRTTRSLSWLRKLGEGS